MQPKTLTRRRHSDDLKAQVLRECSEPGASIAAIALAHGLNANLVHRWRRLASRSRAVQTQPALAPFIPLPMLAAPDPTPTPPADIRIELRRGATTVSLIQSARMNGHDPYAYLKDVLTRLPTHKASQIEELLPHRWKPAGSTDA